MKATAERSEGPQRGSKWLPALLVTAGVLVYANSLSGPFIFDDDNSITENPYIRRLWPIWEAMSAPHQATVAGRPVVSLSLALNYAVGGLDVRGYHIFNVAIHILCSFVLFGIVRRTLVGPVLSASYSANAAWLAGAVALIWLVHPLVTESVNYVIQRTELLMALFYLLTLYGALRGWSSARPRGWFVGAVVACALGMGSEEVMVSAPVVVLLYDRLFVSGSFGGALRRHRGLYAGLAGTWIILAALMLPGPRSDSVGFDHDVAALDYLCTQAGVILWYLRLAFWPDALVISYNDWPVVHSFAESAPEILAILALLGGTGWALWRKHGLGFLGVCFFLILAPTSSFVPIVTEVAAERRVYLPLAAVVGATVIGAHAAICHMVSRRPSQSRSLSAIQGGLAIAVAGLLGWGTVERNRDYRSATAIWGDAA
ncbi:MAG: hypothetical protein V2A79_20395, partial [Planctomycetota bacterium]